MPKRISMALACAASIVISSGAAHADKTTLTLSTQLGIDYLPILMMKHDRLIEKHAAALGLGAITVRLISLTGAAATNEALLSGSVDVIAGTTYPAAPQLLPFYQRLFSLYSSTAGQPLPVLGCPLTAAGGIAAGAVPNGDGCANRQNVTLSSPDHEQVFTLRIDQNINPNNLVWYRFQADTGGSDRALCPRAAPRGHRGRDAEEPRHRHRRGVRPATG